MAPRLKSVVPRGLYGRAALILIVPVVTIQLVVSIAFIQRHFDGVTRQMTENVAREIELVVAAVEAGSDAAVTALAETLDLTLIRPGTPAPADDGRLGWDLSGLVVAEVLAERLVTLRGLTFREAPRAVTLHLQTAVGPVDVRLPRRRVSASNPHQLLVWMIATSVLMTLVAFYFLRAQLRPITRLAVAAEAFGKGQVVAYRPRGAVEVRAAGRAFLDMRARIERQIEQRTLMLSGVSHDLRTPLTRLRLGLSMLPEDEEVRALMADVSQMQRMVDEFLAFARGDAMEATAETDLAALVAAAVADAVRAGGAVSAGEVAAVTVAVRPQAVRRALDNLIGNAVRFGTRAVVTLQAGGRQVRLAVEDDGPGIPPGRRDEALSPFVRLDAARDPNRGGGTGLGLAIAADIARSHGGELRLGDSRALGGLRAELVLAR